MGKVMAFFFLLFVLLPIGLIVLLYSAISGKTGCLKLLLIAGGAGAFLLLLMILIYPSWQQIELEPEDYLGSYIIDRYYFRGPQADWQYNHFRFKIRKPNKVFFYQTEGAKIEKVYRGKAFWITKGHSSARIHLEMDSPTHFIIASDPTTFRFVDNFRLVFNTTRFGNVRFRKEKWEALKKK